MGITRGKDLHGRRDRHRHSDSIEVARGWLRLGVGSAAVAAALLGSSLWGAAPAVAEGEGGESSMSSSATASNDDSASGDDSASKDDARGEDASGEDESADAEPTADKLDAGDDSGPDDTEDTGADTEDTADDTEGAGGLAAESDEGAAEPDDPGNDTGGGDDAVAAGATPVGQDSAVGGDSTRDAAQRPATGESAPAQPDSGTVVQPAAVSVTAPTARPTSWQEVVARVLDDWTASHQEWIDSLEVSDATKQRLEASFLAMRRTFFNQVPVVEPIQITGRLSGPVTGSVAGVDPDGDEVRYVLARAPREGALDLAADGSYVYTPDEDFDGVDTFRVLAVDSGLHVNLLDPFRGLGARVNPVINQDAITFQFNYTDGAEHWTGERREALLRAADQLMLYLLVDAPVTLTYAVTGQNAVGSGTLASAGSALVSGLPGFWPTVVQRKLVAGTDANGSAADGEIEWNFGYAWGLGDVVAADQFDFTSVVLHELMHSLGFLTTVGEAGDNAETTWQNYDRFIVRADGTKAIDSRYRWIDDFDDNLTGGNGGLYFGGANAVAAHGGLVPLYTPAKWAPGSSMHHLDDDTFTGGDEKLMNSATGTGPAPRVLSDIEIGILRDLGYHVVPQAPSSATAMLALVLVGFRRRRRAPAEDR